LEVWKNEKCYRQTQAVGNCKGFHSFSEYSKTFANFSINLKKHRDNVLYFFKETPQKRKGKSREYSDYQTIEERDVCTKDGPRSMDHPCRPGSYTNPCAVVNQSAVTVKPSEAYPSRLH